MFLNKLYNKSILNEDDRNAGLPLEPGRYPEIRQHVVADYKPNIDIEAEVKALKEMVFKYPPSWAGDEKLPPDYESAVKEYRRSQSAFRRLLQRLQLNPMSGLRGEAQYTRLSKTADEAAGVRNQGGLSTAANYIVIAADVDNMKYLNDVTGLGHQGVNAILQNIGTLFSTNFRIENTKLFHPHGDEFRVISYVGDLDAEGVRLRFIRLLQGCIEVADKLASTGFYIKGWPETKRVQPTMSFGISTTDASADGILTHVKSGTNNNKSMKYVIVLDKDLRFNLDFSVELMNKYIKSLNRSSNSAQIMLADNPKSPPTIDGLHESNNQIDNMRNKKGVALLECSWNEIPISRKKELNAIKLKKREYLDFPNGAIKVGDRYYPLKEKYKPSL